jgi:hypothetical protein
MESENHKLRRQVVDLHYENTYMRKITEMQTEIISLKQQIINLKNENIRLSHLISKTKNSNQDSESNSDEEYYTADEGSDNIDRICQYCK